MTRPLRRLAFAAASLIALAATAGPVAAQGPARGLTPKDLVMLDRASDLHISPDGRWVVYSLRATDWDNNKGVTSIWLVEAGGKTPPRRLAISDKGANSARWSADGRFIYFISSRSGSDQLWRTTPEGADAVQVSNLPLDVQAYRLAPDGKHLVVSLAVLHGSGFLSDCRSEIECTVKHNKPDGKASGRVYDRVFVRHWDTWADGTDNHLFALALDANGVAAGDAVALTPGLDADIPRKPFGGDDDFDISPDGRTVAFSAKIAGATAPWSTNFDIFSAPMDGSKAPTDLTPNNPAEDDGPVFSPDGSSLAWRAMKRPGFEADRYGVMVMDLKTGQAREVDPNWDRSPGALTWSKDSKTLYLTATDTGQQPIFALDPKGGGIKALTGPGTVAEFDVSKSGIVYAHNDFGHPNNLFAIGLKGGAAQQLTHHDEDKLAGVAMGDYEQFSFPGWNGETVHGYVVKPWNYQPGRKYPVAFLIHGGPQGSWESSWSYRWNPQTYTGAGYAVVMIDFHGSTGYGQGFTDAISQHWGDRPLEDLQKGWAAAQQKYPFLDGDHACALGASYGGYMVYWIAGNWSQPWKCLVDHDGVFDNRVMGYATEELWFSEWENGGTVYGNPAGYEQFNPVLHVAQWNKPMLVIHSARDYRIPLDQGLAAFNALQRKGIPSRLLTFPDENHWVLKPQNSLLWHETVLDWLNEWTAK
jgi:acylaminoacyl-peptidase